MWKTRFEVSTSNNKNSIHPRNFPSSSTFIHHYYTSQISPTVPRVREDSSSAIVRPLSIPNLEILPEEDEDSPYLTLTNNEQSNFLTSTTLRKQNSYQTILPTIIESHDHEGLFDTNNINNERTYIVQIEPQDSFGATNTNYHHPMNNNIERKERELHSNKNEFTINKRINELLKQNQKKLTVEKDDIFIPSTFKDISAFFENKISTSEPKKIIRAKRSLSVNKYIPTNQNDVLKQKFTSTIEEEESSILYHQIKRIKKTHQSECDFNIKPHSAIDENVDHRLRTIEHEKQSLIMMINNSLKKTLSKRWFILLLITNILFIYVYFSHLISIYIQPFRLNSFVNLENYSSDYFPQQSQVASHSINTNFISQYEQFIRKYSFAFLELFATFISQIFFRIDKYEYKHNIIYVATSTYEQLYDWFIHLFK